MKSRQAINKGRIARFWVESAVGFVAAIALWSVIDDTPTRIAVTALVVLLTGVVITATETFIFGEFPISVFAGMAPTVGILVAWELRRHAAPKDVCYILALAIIAVGFVTSQLLYRRLRQPV